MRLHSCAWLLFAAAGLTGTVGCGDDKASPDAPKTIDGKVFLDAPIDGPDVVGYDWDEGGEIRWEYQEIFRGPPATTPNRRTRATSFWWKSKTPKRYPFPAIPGCTRQNLDDHFPLGMGTTHEYLDVGDITVSGGTAPLTIPLGAMPADDYARPQDGIWHFFRGNPDTGSEMYTSNFDAYYNVAFSGSAEWPAQTYTNALYMPAAWQLVTPPFAPTPLPADQPLVITYTSDPATHLPTDGSTVNMVAALIVGGMGPVLDCIDDDINHGTITIPADDINFVRALSPGGGMFARAHVSHRLQELTNDVTHPHTHQRMDFISIWCYVVPWTAP